MGNHHTHNMVATRSISSTERKFQRKENRLADKGKPSRKHLRSEEAEITVHQNEAKADANETNVRRASKRSDKLQRQLNNLLSKNASWEKVLAKAEAVSKTTYREARVADMGRRKSGFKTSAHAALSATQQSVQPH